MDVSNTEQQLNANLNPHGLSVFGWLSMFGGPSEFDGKTTILVGNRGRAMWGSFCLSEYSKDGQSDPLDRWTRTVIEPLQKKFGAKALYPFLDGSSRHWPFQQWAKAACGLQQSPAGMLIDPDYGLWQAFRAVLVLDRKLALPEVVPAVYPCNTCVDKPCLKTCPVDAVSKTAFDAATCRRHVKSSTGIRCHDEGCIARNACPIGQDFAYSAEQQAFHMQAYLL